MKHTIHSRSHHWRWDNSLDPVVTVEPGDTIKVELLDSGGGQIGPSSTAAQAAQLDFGRVNPVTGPIAIQGAEPGDAIRLTLLSVAPCDWGWSAIIPGFGLLADDFPEPYLHLWTYDKNSRLPVHYARGAHIPLRPMIGSIGLAPARPGAHDILPPRRVGGTMNICDLGEGAQLYLPVEVAGGLLSLGDGHAAQGDGEVCGTGLETAMTVVTKIDLVKSLCLPGPRFMTAEAQPIHSKGYWATTGIGPSLMTGAIDATRAMIDLLIREHGTSAEEAYLLCSLAGQLRISEIVDRPNWIVCQYFPRSVFE